MSTPLQEMIKAKYRSQQKCADELGWTKQKLSNIVLGKQNATIEDARALASVLDVSVDVVAKKFLRTKSTKT